MRAAAMFALASILMAGTCLAAPVAAPQPRSAAAVDPVRVIALRAEADAGDAGAALKLGLMYDTGHGVSQNESKALTWYRRAAEAGNVDAMFNVGALYDSGRLGTADRTKAVHWYKMAAKHGLGRAEYDLALMYQDGDGVKKDKAQAMHYFAAAARHGIEAARRRMASVERVPTERVTVSQMPGQAAGGSAAFGRAQALLLDRGLPAGGAKATQLLAEAAARGDALAEYDLGYCYENGIGRPVDKAKAYAWYERAAATNGTAVKKAAASGLAALRPQLTVAERAAARAVLPAAGAR